MPWIDERGDQAKYARTVDLWKTLHNRLPAINACKILEERKRIMMQSQQYGHAQNLCFKIPPFKIESANGSDAIVNALHKRDALAVVSEVLGDFLLLLNAKRSPYEHFINFESRFETQVSKFHFH